MPHRLVIRLALALLGLVVALVGGLAVLIVATSAPVLPPPPLPTATPQPAPLAQPGIRSGLGADPNGAVRTLIDADPVSDIAAVDTVYRDTAHPHAANPPCDPGGQWALQVDPENVVGYPYSKPPSGDDWARAAAVVDTVTSICPAPIALSWYAHDKARPSSDRWTALLPSTLAPSIDSPTLMRYVLAHARQQ